MNGCKLIALVWDEIYLPIHVALVAEELGISGRGRLGPVPSETERRYERPS